jgi:hypothetical protein
MMRRRERYYRVSPLGERIPINWLEEKIRRFQHRNDNDVEKYNDGMEDDENYYDREDENDFRSYRDPDNTENEYASEDGFGRDDERHFDDRENNFRRSDRGEYRRRSPFPRKKNQ